MSDEHIVIKAAALALPVALGAFAARMGWLGEPGAAMRALNAYALRVAFPALVCAGLLGSESLGSGSWGEVWVWMGLWPAVLGVMLVVTRVCVGSARRGSAGLVMVFGNVAYLGLPLVALLWGEAMLGRASWLVSVHVMLGVTLGTWWAARHGSRHDTDGVSLSAVAGQPLCWAPIVGAGLGWLGSDGVQAGVRQLIWPIAQSAAPVALFMLGVYLWQQRRVLRQMPDAVLLAHVLACLVVVPCAVGAAALACVQAGWMSVEMMRLHIVLGAMPVGITTFSMAFDADCSPERVAQSIVWSTVGCVVTLPVWIWVVGA